MKFDLFQGSDGHTLALTSEGSIFSWGDGDYGKLGHGSSLTYKIPKLIAGPLSRRVRNFDVFAIRAWQVFSSYFALP